MKDDELNLSLYAMQEKRAALAALVCPFFVGDLLRQRDIKSVDNTNLGELTTLVGVSRRGDPPPSWLKRETMDFHVDRIDFQWPLNGDAIPLDRVASSWRLQGSMRNHAGISTSGEALMELSPTALAPRVSRERRLLPRVANDVLQATLDDYTQAYRRVQSELALETMGSPRKLGP